MIVETEDGGTVKFRGKRAEYRPRFGGSELRALDALRHLVEYGKTSYRSTEGVGLGMALGMALSKCDVRPSQLLDAVGEALEDQNLHALAAIVRALKSPRNLRRNDRSVTVELPEWFHTDEARVYTSYCKGRFTYKQLAEMHPAFTINQIRRIVRERNGRQRP